MLRGALRCGLIVGAVAFANGCGNDDEASCDELASRVASAASGDVVELPACTVSVAVVVPAGVTLRGAGIGQTVLSPADGAAIVLTPGAAPTTLERLSVRGTTRKGVVANGVGAIAISDVEVVPSRGLAIEIVDVTSAALRNVTMQGPVDVANASDYPIFADASMDAIQGLAVRRSVGVSLTTVVARGFAANGVTFEGSDVDWDGGGAPGNLFNGVYQSGGELRASGLDLCGTLRGQLQGGTYAGVFVALARVLTNGLRVCDTEGIGLLHDGADLRHEALDATGNDDVAVVAQRCSGVALLGSASLLSGNGSAGIVVLDSINVMIADITVERTVLVPRVSGLGGLEQIGDGIQLVRTGADAPPFDAQLTDVTLDHNGRAGVLLDAGGGNIGGLAMDGVRADGEDDQLGVVAQQVSALPVDWDRGVAREGATVANDASFDDVLAVVQIVDPPMIAEVEPGL